MFPLRAVALLGVVAFAIVSAENKTSETEAALRNGKKVKITGSGPDHGRFGTIMAFNDVVHLKLCMDEGDIKYFWSSDISIVNEEASSEISYLVEVVGASVCPSSFSKLTEAQCMIAAGALGFAWNDVQDRPERPGGCWKAKGVDKVNFNQNAGSRAADVSPICIKSQVVEPISAPSPAPKCGKGVEGGEAQVTDGRGSSPRSVEVAEEIGRIKAMGYLPAPTEAPPTEEGGEAQVTDGRGSSPRSVAEAEEIGRIKAMGYLPAPTEEPPTEAALRNGNKVKITGSGPDHGRFGTIMAFNEVGHPKVCMDDGDIKYFWSSDISIVNEEASSEISYLVEVVGASVCPSGFSKLTEAQCRIAVGALGFAWNDVQDRPERPGGCWKAKGVDKVNFNQNAGSRAADVSPICIKSQVVEPISAPSPAPKCEKGVEGGEAQVTDGKGSSPRSVAEAEEIGSVAAMRHILRKSALSSALRLSAGHRWAGGVGGVICLLAVLLTFVSKRRSRGGNVRVASGEELLE